MLGQLSFVLSFSLSFLFFFAKTVSLLTIWELSQSSWVYSPCPHPHPLKGKETQVQSVLPTHLPEHDQTPSDQPHKETWIFPQLHLCPQPSTVESYTSAPLSQFLSFWWLPVWAIFLHTITKVASLPFSQQEHRSWTYIWSLATTQTTDSVCGLCCGRGLCWFQWSVLPSETMLRSFST